MMSGVCERASNHIIEIRQPGFFLPFLLCTQCTTQAMFQQTKDGVAPTPNNNKNETK